jgi:hypothetical protein
MPMSSSSSCEPSAPVSSALGAAAATRVSTPTPRASAAHSRKALRSRLLIPPMGLTSAAEQSYLV